MLEFLDKLFTNIGTSSTTPNDNIPSVTLPNKEEREITLSQENNFHKIEISDYVSIERFNEIIASYNEFATIINNISFFNAFWNSTKQKINKGTYHITTFDDRIYCIFFDGKKILVDEVTKKEIDEETSRKNITEEKVLIFDIWTKQYSYTFYKHDELKSTYAHMFYDNYREILIPEFELSQNDAYAGINALICNLENIPGINHILDITLLKEYILKDLKCDTNQRRRTPKE